MRRVVCGMAVIMSAAFAGCTSPEPVGPLTAAPMGGERTVVVTPSEATLAVGEAQQFSAEVFNNGDPQKKAVFTWTSSDTSVATVSSTGLVTAVAAGEATITATSAQTSGSARVTVQQPAQVVATIPLGGGPFGSVVSSAGIAWISQPRLGQLSRLDIAAASFTAAVSGGPFPVQVSANADGSRIYTPSFFSDGMVTSINTETVAPVDTVFVRPFEDAYGVTNTPTGDTVFVGITNGPVFKVDMRGRTVLGTLELPVAAGYHFEWNKTRTRLYASQRAFDGGRVFELDPHSFTLLRTFETGGAAQGIQLSADDTKLFIAAQNGGVIVWDVASNSLLTTYATPGCSGYGLLRTPDDTRLFVGCVFEGLVQVLDPSTGALIASVTVGGSPRELSYDASSGSLIVPNENGWVDIIR